MKNKTEVTNAQMVKIRPNFLKMGLVLFILAVVLFPLRSFAGTFSIFPVAVAPTITSAAVTWVTSGSTDSQINYGLTSSYGSSTVYNSNLVVHHSQIITGLSPGTTYHYQVVSSDANHNSVMSPDSTFTTLSLPTGIVKTVMAGGGGNYATISACASAAQPGWTCLVYPGIYNEIVSFMASGTASSPITFEAQGDVVVAGFSLSNQSYININGFEVTTIFNGSSYETCSLEHDGFYLNKVSHITISNNYIHHIYDGSFVKWPYRTPSNYVTVLNNIMEFAGMIAVGSAPCPQGNGSFAGIEGWGSYNLFDGNVASEADHMFEVAGSYNVFRRNIWHDTSAADWGANTSVDHVDFFHPFNVGGGISTIHNVIEDNKEYNTNYSNQHFLLAEGVTDQNSQLLGTGDSSTTMFNGILSLTNTNGTDTGIAPFSVVVVVGSGSGTMSAVDNGFGNLVNFPGGSGVSAGTINYLTGAISVAFSDAPASGVQVSANYKLQNLGTHDVIVRYNLAYNLGSYFINGSDGGFPGIRAYNNTMVDIGFQGTSTQSIYAAYGFSGIAPHWTVMNSIYEDAWEYTNGNPPWTIDSAQTPPAQIPGYGLVYNDTCAPNCPYASSISSPPGMILNKNPLFNSPTSYDFTLQSQSPARNAGSSLTTVASSDVGNGTTLVVNDAGFLQDGYGITGVLPDWIAVGTSANAVAISSINYATNTIILATAIARKAGDPVWLYKDSTGLQVLNGNAPDLGAFPYTAFSPSMYGDVNGDGQVTIADAQLIAQAAIGGSVSNFNATAAQVDGTGKVDIYDAYLIVEYAAGLVTKFLAQNNSGG